jgi:class 3 adenylate cyclase
VLPETLYARSGDVNVAYQVTGRGDVDLVWAPGTISHLDLDWEWPSKARVIEGLGAFCRLIRFDKRGTGLSDRPTTAATLEERTDDIRAVMDAAESERAALFGLSEGGSMACFFAATYPERVSGLVLWGVQARWVATDDYPWGLSSVEDASMIDELKRNWPSLDYLLGPGAGLGGDADPALIDWVLRYARAAASPAAIVALEEMNARIDISGILPSIRVPTLVMNRTGDPVAHIDAARDLAARIAGARFVEWPGETHSLAAGDEERILAEIEEFVTGRRSRAASERVLATILFADVAGSTERAARLGDGAWRDLLERYYRAAERELATYGGTEIDRAGDGLFALFDGPTRAIRCALALRAAGVGLGLPLRCGVHTGEVERDHGSARGIAVHVAARVAAAAGPSEVLVSVTVCDLSAGSGISFEDRGEHALKGFERPYRLFSVQ